MKNIPLTGKKNNPKHRLHDDIVYANAWLGDAVLALYVREFILNKYQCVNGDLFAKCTSNAFLRQKGNPTVVEATIGDIYQQDGLAAAFQWIKQELVPLFKQQIKQAELEK